MDDTGKLLDTITKLDGKSAPIITHTLKYLGNGNMQNGIARIANHSLIKGIMIGAICAGIWNYFSNHESNKETAEAQFRE